MSDLPENFLPEPAWQPEQPEQPDEFRDLVMLRIKAPGLHMNYPPANKLAAALLDTLLREVFARHDLAVDEAPVRQIFNNALILYACRKGDAAAMCESIRETLAKITVETTPNPLTLLGRSSIYVRRAGKTAFKPWHVPEGQPEVDLSHEEAKKAVIEARDHFFAEVNELHAWISAKLGFPPSSQPPPLPADPAP